MRPDLDQRFPSIPDMERTALRRLPRFMGQYIEYGMGRGDGVRRNSDDLRDITLLPSYSCEVGEIVTETSFLGQNYAVPFGVAPVGLGGLAWPGAPETLAAAARLHRLPFTGATYSFAGLEELAQLAGEFGWFQLYRPSQPDIEADMLKRALDSGYKTLIVTVDVPGPVRRIQDIRNGFSLPPRFNLDTIVQLLTHPRWSLAVGLETLRNGFPHFANVARYMPKDSGSGSVHELHFTSNLTVGHISTAVFEGLRKAWPHNLIAKGVLDPKDACRYRELGADAIVVSNHGGRQLEAAPSSARMLPIIRDALGKDFPLLVDGGVRSGLDVCRMLALGADFVLLGRPFYYAMAAMGLVGAEHVMELLKQELVCTMDQLGCSEIDQLTSRLCK